jgi:hypothetical protein
MLGVLCLLRNAQICKVKTSFGKSPAPSLILVITPRRICTLDPPEPDFFSVQGGEGWAWFGHEKEILGEKFQDKLGIVVGAGWERGVFKIRRGR